MEISKHVRGFSLVELLIVIGIMLVLSAIVTASILNSRIDARDNKRIADLKQLQLALETYRQIHDQYPNGGTCTGSGSFGGGGCLAPLVSEGLIRNLPIDPTNSGAQQYSYDSDTGSCATPVNPPAGTAYRVWVTSEADEPVQTNTGWLATSTIGVTTCATPGAF